MKREGRFFAALRMTGWGQNDRGREGRFFAALRMTRVKAQNDRSEGSERQGGLGITRKNQRPQ